MSGLFFRGLMHAGDEWFFQWCLLPMGDLFSTIRAKDGWPFSIDPCWRLVTFFSIMRTIHWRRFLLCVLTMGGLFQWCVLRVFFQLCLLKMDDLFQRWMLTTDYLFSSMMRANDGRRFFLFVFVLFCFQLCLPKMVDLFQWYLITACDYYKTKPYSIKML